MAKQFISGQNKVGITKAFQVEEMTTFEKFTIAPATAEAISRAGIKEAFETKITPRDVQEQVAVESLIEKNVTVAERLTILPAQNANQNALAGLQVLIQRLMALNPTGKSYTGVNLRDKSASGYVKKGATTPATIGEMIDSGGPANQAAFTTVGGDPSAVVDQATHFYRAIVAVDNKVLILRQVEARIAEYKRLRDEAVALQKQLLVWQAEAESRLAIIIDEVETARHHLSLAQQLKAEEQNRIDAVNARRKVVRDSVDVVVFYKQRLLDRFTALPVTEASSISIDGTLQIPLRELDAVPADISDMVNNFRAAPLLWFPALESLPQFFDRPALVINAFEHIRIRSATVAPPVFQALPATNGFARAARSMIVLQSERANHWRKAGLQLDTQNIELEGIAASHRRLRQAATLGDMIDAGHGSAKAIKMSARQFESISRAAETLYASFADTPAERRLRWAEALMEDGGQMSFRALSVLPGWVTLTVDLRREQQGVVDQLYRQVADNNAEAVTAINRLVLVCLLVAAHAPVTQLLNARLLRPAVAQAGVLIDLALDVTNIRVGMAVTVQNNPGQTTARAVIDDIVGGLARARIVEAIEPNTTIGINALVQLSESMAFKSSILPGRQVHFK
jgi:hypothetical protein